MHIFDSVKKTKLEFIPQEPNKAVIYLCGPTVYDDAHLGHAKSAVAFDLLRRVLMIDGYDVTFIRNITDIDDKIINKSIESGESIESIATKYTASYHCDMDALGVKRADIEPRATESIESMVELIKKLLEKNHAYKISNGDIYFDTHSDKKYLSISNRKSDEHISRIESVSEKRNGSDFVLWKIDDKIGFDSVLGKGRPGWHIECSAMIEKHTSLKNKPYSIDIHAGGADLIFPHHENEAAQTRCAAGREIAAYWMHNGFVTIDNEKMSKSLGNSFFLKDLLEKFHGEVIRYYLQSVHYRADFNFDIDDLIASKKRLDKLYRLKKRLFGVKSNISSREFKDAILEALRDDLNVSKAYATIDEFINSANEYIDKNAKDKTYNQNIVANIEFLGEVFAIGSQDPFIYFQFGIDEAMREKIETLIKERAEAKKAKDFTKADSIRDELTAFGVSIMDTANGTMWEIRD